MAAHVGDFATKRPLASHAPALLFSPRSAAVSIVSDDTHFADMLYARPMRAYASFPRFERIKMVIAGLPMIFVSDDVPFDGIVITLYRHHVDTRFFRVCQQSAPHDAGAAARCRRLFSD